MVCTANNAAMAARCPRRMSPLMPPDQPIAHSAAGATRPARPRRRLPVPGPAAPPEPGEACPGRHWPRSKRHGSPARRTPTPPRPPPARPSGGRRVARADTHRPARAITGTRPPRDTRSGSSNGRQQGPTELPSNRRSVAFCPPSRKWIISPAHPHFRWRGCRVFRHGHGTTSAAVCRGMPFCPCYARVDLRPGPGLVLHLCWRQNPAQPGTSAPQSARACSSRMAIPAATRRTGGPGAGPHERFRSTSVRCRRDPPSRQHRPAQRQRTLCLLPITTSDPGARLVISPGDQGHERRLIRITTG